VCNTRQIFSRSFSTFNKFESNDENIIEDDITKDISDDPSINNYSDLSYEKAKELKDFHTKYDVYSGFYGYSHIFHLGTYSDFKNLEYNSFLISKILRNFLATIPENEILTILPLIRFEIPGADSSTLTLTNAIKVTKHTPVNLLGIKIFQLIKNKFTFYNLYPQAVDVLIMGRP
jgi:hypothetical protein